MSTVNFLGMWYCELVDQEQSDEAAEQFGEYDDSFGRGPRKATKTEYAKTTLELGEDGTYRMTSEHDAFDSFGSWTEQGGEITLRESPDCSNGYDGLEYAYPSGERFVVAFKLVPDAHDGLDVLVLTFGRTPPASKKRSKRKAE